MRELASVSGRGIMQPTRNICFWGLCLDRVPGSHNDFQFIRKTVQSQKSLALNLQVISYGAALRTLLAPDSQGNFEDVVLGHDSVAGYEKGDGYLGVTVGRVANRIAKGKFSVAGKAYQLEKVNAQTSAIHATWEKPFSQPLYELPCSWAGCCTENGWKLCNSCVDGLSWLCLSAA